MTVGKDAINWLSINLKLLVDHVIKAAKPTELVQLINEVQGVFPDSMQQLDTINWAYRQLYERDDTYRLGLNIKVNGILTKINNPDFQASNQ